MIKYTPQNQLTLEGFEHPFERDLDKNNRWVRLSYAMPWDKLANAYAHKLRSDCGRYSVDVRMVIAAMIIKHKLQLSDREVVDTISENIYLQYFCGLKAFTIKKPFDASLLVNIRKRMGATVFDQFNNTIIEAANQEKDKGKQGKNKPSFSNKTKKSDAAEPKPSGKLQLDATIADQMIKFPTDLNLLNDSREQAERIIDKLYKGSGLKKKPRDYRRVARKDYLNIAKMKRRPKGKLRQGIRKQLQYLKRDLQIIQRLLDHYEVRPSPLSKRDCKILWAIQKIYEQQLFMYENKTNSVAQRIVNIYQPWVRPMVRGKEKAKVEFGSKLNVSKIDGFCKINRINWEAYNEAMDLETQVEEYHKTFGCYPELVLADRIYLNRSNRNYLKSKGIRIVGKPLGRPPKQELSAYQKRKQRKERNERNHIEGKFGQAKNGYGLNRIRAKRQDTSESWIAAIFFIMNLTRLMKIVGDKVIFWFKIQLTNQPNVHKGITRQERGTVFLENWTRSQYLNMRAA